MLWHYFKVAFRNFRFNRYVFVGSLVTICMGGLCISLLFSYVYNALTMDNFHKREKDIFMTVTNYPDRPNHFIQASLLYNFKYSDFPELESLVTLQKDPEGKVSVNYNGSVFSPEILRADSTFFRVFDFQLIEGDKRNVLSDPDAVLVTEQFARKVFGDNDPIGQPLTVRKMTYFVKGILKNPPLNSSITFDMILPISPYVRGMPLRMGPDFILAGPSFDKEAFIKKMEKRARDTGMEDMLNVLSLDEMYFNNVPRSDYGNVISRSGDKKTLYVLFVIMVVIMAITILNFANLQVISINSSLRSMSINEIIGARKIHLLYQKIMEIALILMLSALIVTSAYVLILPFFNTLTKVQLMPSLWEVLILNGAVLLVLLVASMVYPWVMIMRSKAKNGISTSESSGNRFYGRSIVVVFQFALTIIMIISSLFVFKQRNMMLTKDIGFDSEGVVRVKFFLERPVYLSDGSESVERQQGVAFIRSELSSSAAVADFSQGNSLLDPYQVVEFKLRDSDMKYAKYNCMVVIPELDRVLGFKVVEGRFFDLKNDQSGQPKLVINETAQKLLGIKFIGGKFLTANYQIDYEIIGVVKDFNYERLSVPIQPLVMTFFEGSMSDFYIRLQKGTTQEGLQLIQKLFEKVNPSEPFKYSFLSDEVSALYQKEKQLNIIYLVFTVVALIISMTGLFAISLNDTQRRIKEIGIRKVNGARTLEVLALLNKDFVKWVVIAFVIATPIAWYSMHRWLESFAYKTPLSWWIFALAGVLALGIAILTVSWQSWKAATRNPVESLRYE